MAGTSPRSSQDRREPPPQPHVDDDGQHLSQQASASSEQTARPSLQQDRPIQPSPSLRLTVQPPQQRRATSNLDAQYASPTVSSSHDAQHNEKHNGIDTFPNLEVHDSRDNELKSPSINARAEASRLEDDIELLRAERFISDQELEQAGRTRSRISMDRHNNKKNEIQDIFNPTATEEAKVVKHKDEDAPMYKLWLFLKKFPRFIRYFVYLLPGAALLLIPILLGVLAIDQDANPVGGYGGTPLMWFGIWLEIVWGSLWVARMITSLMPHLFHSVARIFGSTSPKKWKDIGEQLELHTALFFWMLAVLISFKPICAGHTVPVPEGHEDDVDREWINIVFKVIIALFVLATLNFVEKILIRWIAEAFHERTYATRIENNKGDIRQLVQLFTYAKGQLQETDSFWQGSGRQSASGAQTPMRALHDNARQVLGKVGQVAGRVGNDFIGRKGVDTNHPRKVVTELLRTTSSAHTLARLIYRSLVRPDQEMVFPEDLANAFTTEEEAEAAFNVFDKDLNGDISMEELEAVTNEIALEKKAIAASLKDLDSVIKKLDKVFLFIILVITIIVFISIISGSAAAGLASAGSSVLGLAWMLQATAQEFLQSIIFVFVKHPFDVGDRVTIYGSTGANMTGDDYYVTEISLLYTEFRKLQGHVVQAPNSLLNTLFILNQRRSNGLADPIPLQIRFGTPGWMIDELKARMLKFVMANKRDYQGAIYTELSAITEMRSATLTVVFIHKSNFQNELLRLARHNKFMLELMAQMDDIGIQSPYRIDPGGSREHPLHWTGMQAPPSYTRENEPDNGPQGPARRPSQMARRQSVTSASSARAEIAQDMSKETTLNNVQDVYENRREHFQASRLASIREKDYAAKRAEESLRQSGSEPRGSSSALAPASSVNSQSRSRLWGRGRSSSKVAHPSMGGEAV